MQFFKIKNMMLYFLKEKNIFLKNKNENILKGNFGN